MIFVIDDNKEMAECIAKATGRECQIFSNAIEAMSVINEAALPEMIFMEVLLDGPDAFTFLNEMISYTDTAKIPIVVVTGVDFLKMDLSVYGVVGLLNKDTFRPEDVKRLVEQYTREVKNEHS